MLSLVVFIVLVALAFDFINGFHDAANSIATVVSTRVLTPLQAVVWATVFNFVAAFGFGVNVATTVGTGVVQPARGRPLGDPGRIAGGDRVEPHHVVLRTAHQLLARAHRGLRGAAVAKGGFAVLLPQGLVKIGAFMMLAPLIGLVVGFALMLVTVWGFRNALPGRVDRLFRRLQLLSAAAYSLGHGTNDAQKTMGIIAVLLFSTGYLPEFTVPCG